MKLIEAYSFHAHQYTASRTALTIHAQATLPFSLSFSRSCEKQKKSQAHHPLKPSSGKVSFPLNFHRNSQRVLHADGARMPTTHRNCSVTHRLFSFRATARERERVSMNAGSRNGNTDHLSLRHFPRFPRSPSYAHRYTHTQRQ